jgi:molecular chaperone GrpE
VPTATTVMRRGYQLRDRLLRPAMVGVTDPARPTEAPAATNAPSVDETSESSSEM